jgi:1-acyl-sn-glycerol-3-phosphate acyltransferase
VGKALIEAVLRALPDVERLYVLIRPRTDAVGRRVDVARRLRDDVFASSAFDALRERHGEGFESFVAEKVVAVEGELARDRLGLDEATYERLRAEVDVVIGNGAMAVFDAPLDQAVHTNALGPKRLLDFARGAARRPFVAHVSTCYVSNVAGPVFETHLPPDWTPAGPDPDDPFDPDREVERLLAHADLVRSGRPTPATGPWWRALPARSRSARGTAGTKQRRRSADDIAYAATKRLVADGMRWARRRGWRDTYTFTKALGEQLFDRHRGDVPGMILRPAIIESALRTPAPGWIDGFRMIDPLIVGYARGQLGEFPGNPESVLDVVPVDAVVNALLMSIPFAHEGGGPDVYQVASSADNPLSVKAFRDLVQEHYRRSPLRRARPGNGGDLPDLAFPELRTFLRRIELYLLPVRVMETVYRLFERTALGRSRRSALSARRARLTWLRDMAAIYGPYAESGSRFLAFNLQRAWRATPAADREALPFDVRGLDWRRYVQDVHLPGIERYLLSMREQRRAPVALDAVLAEPDASRGAATSARASTSGDTAAETRTGARSDWRGAEQVLGLTRSATPAQATAWTTPTYKLVTRRASLLALRVAGRARLDLRWDGSEHLPERGPFIVVANHTSHVDTGVLLAAIGPHATQTHPTAAADYWFKRPAVAWFLSATLGGVPFERQRRNVARALALPAQVLRNGRSLIFFPEGTRSLDGTLQPFHSALGLLALASAAPIVPAHITGAAQALPKGRVVIRQHPVRVRFGPSIRIEPYLTSLERESVASVARRLAHDAQAAVERLAPGTHHLEEDQP